MNPIELTTRKKMYTFNRWPVCHIIVWSWTNWNKIIRKSTIRLATKRNIKNKNIIYSRMQKKSIKWIFIICNFDQTVCTYLRMYAISSLRRTPCTATVQYKLCTHISCRCCVFLECAESWELWTHRFSLHLLIRYDNTQSHVESIIPLFIISCNQFFFSSSSIHSIVEFPFSSTFAQWCRYEIVLLA